MKTAIPGLWAVFCVALAASLAPAQYPACSPVFRQPLAAAPDGCGPGSYYYDCYGTLYGPSYHVYPPFPPFNGILPGPTPTIGKDGKPYLPPPNLPGGQYGPPNFLTHPYARSPRDFFMWNEAQQDRFTREQLPRFVP